MPAIFMPALAFFLQADGPIEGLKYRQRLPVRLVYH